MPCTLLAAAIAGPRSGRQGPPWAAAGHEWIDAGCAIMPVIT